MTGGQVWTHQADALAHLCSRRNVVVSTGTAFGKSLIFQIYALHHLLTDPDGKVLVFYPLRALTNDQLVSWRRLAETAGLDQEVVARIYGGVPMSEREQIMERSRIVLMTPDVCQAWLMRTLDNPIVSRFIDSLVLLVLDEAHVYESVFGSNAAFLLRRLIAAKRRLSPRGASSRSSRPQRLSRIQPSISKISREAGSALSTNRRTALRGVREESCTWKGLNWEGTARSQCRNYSPEFAPWRNVIAS